MASKALFKQYEKKIPRELWKTLTASEQIEYLRLIDNFHHGPKVSSKDRRVITFTNELNILHDYLECSSSNLDERCLLVGLCFVGPIVCVNTRQLKGLLNRSKSSINNSFQMLGYVALKSKAVARDCVLAALPGLNKHQSIMKQWTARYASVNALFCMRSSHIHKKMPEILPEHLFVEKPRTRAPIDLSNHLNAVTPTDITAEEDPQNIEFPDFSSYFEVDLGNIGHEIDLLNDFKLEDGFRSMANDFDPFVSDMFDLPM